MKERKQPAGLSQGLTHYGDAGFARYLRRSFAKSMGYSAEALDRPVVGIAYPPSGYSNCHRHFPELLEAVKRGDMHSILQDGQAQALGAIDVAIKAVNPDYEPTSGIWEKYPEMKWNNGESKQYNVPWTPVTADNVDELLQQRQ